MKAKLTIILIAIALAALRLMGPCVRVWVTADDERTCAVCEALEGTKISMDEEFDFSRVNSRLPSGPTPPAHPNCRCAVDYEEIGPAKFSQKPLANTAGNSIMRDIIRKPDGTLDVIGHEVTDSTLQNIPKVSPEGWDSERADKLQAAHQALLRAIKDLPLGTEKVCYYTIDMQLLDSRIGEDKSGSVVATEFSGEYISMHNHPTGLIFSPGDIENFISYPGMVIASVVGHNGKVYLLQKLENYEAANFLKGLIRLEKDLKPLQSLATEQQIQHAQEIVDLVEDFLKGAGQYGVKFVTGG